MYKFLTTVFVFLSVLQLTSNVHAGMPSCSGPCVTGNYECRDGGTDPSICQSNCVACCNNMCGSGDQNCLSGCGPIPKP